MVGTKSENLRVEWLLLLLFLLENGLVVPEFEWLRLRHHLLYDLWQSWLHYESPVVSIRHRDS